MKTAYSYIRWSTSLQGESTRDSRKRQTDSAANWLRDYGKNQYVLSDEKFIDAGKSGHKGEHIATDEYGKAKGELRRFIQLVEDGTLRRDSILLIDSVDRFSRLKPTKALELFLEVISSGIGLVFTGSYEKRIINAELIDKEGHILQFIIGEMIRSFNESAEKSRKIISAKQAKKEKMQAGNIVAHNNVPKYFSFDKVKSVYIHNQNTDIVRGLIKGIQEGKSLYSMADSLNARKVATFRWGYQWSGNSISRILQNRVLIGEYLGVKNFLPPIIEEDEFQRIQNILQNNTYNGGALGKVVNIFRGICFCSQCGKPMQVSAQWVANKKKLAHPYRYLKCSRANSGKNADCTNHKLIRLEPMEMDFFTNFLIKNPYDLMNGDDKAELKAVKKAIAANQSRLNAITKDIETALALLETVALDELKVKLNTLNKQREQVKMDIDKLNLQANSIQDAPNRLDGIKIKLTDFDLAITREATVYEDTMEQVKKALAANTTREQLKVMLPSVVGRLTVDTEKRQYFVYNRMGRMIYQSGVFPSQRNSSEVWKQSLKRAKAITPKMKRILAK